MELTFLSQDLREQCEKRDAAIARLGDAAAVKFVRILADMVAHEKFGNFQAMYSTQVSIIGTEVCIRFDADFSLFCGSGNPDDFSGVTIDWPNVERMKILRIEDRHA